MAWAGLDRLRELKPVHLGHVQVENGQIESVADRLIECLQGLAAAGRASIVHRPSLDLVGQDLAIGGIVIDDENAQPVEALGQADRQAGIWILLAERQFEPEQRSLPGPAMQADLPVHGFDQTLGDGQTEAAATETAGSRTVGLDEGAE